MMMKKTSTKPKTVVVKAAATAPVEASFAEVVSLTHFWQLYNQLI